MTPEAVLFLVSVLAVLVVGYLLTGHGEPAEEEPTLDTRNHWDE